MYLNKRIILTIGLVMVFIVSGFFVLRFLFPLTFLGPLELKLEVPATVSVGDHTVFKLHVKNTSNNDVEFNLAGIPGHGFIISQHGINIWNSRVWHTDSRESKTLSPSEELVLETIWDQNTSSPPPRDPGTYQIRGVLYLAHPDGELSSPKQKIEIR